MTWNNQTITTMGIISDEAYKEKYFTDDAVEKGVKVDGTTYTVIDHTDTSSDMQALLLESGGQYVIAFRGTAGLVDITVDAIIGLGNINAQYKEALAFVKKAYKIDGVEGHLTLTGHSLGGILTQQVGAKLHIDGYAFNAYGVDAANKNFNLTNEREVA